MLAVGVESGSPFLKEAAGFMAGFGDLVKKAFYLGVGLAATAGEAAGGNFGKLREQAQKLADEMVAKGEMTAEEAKRMVDEMVTKAQQQQPTESPPNAPNPEPRRIEILSEDEESTEAKPENVDALRDQVSALQEELRRLQRDR
jgi:polyhydroxyalkanoate synthesis regulator phasin